MQDRLRTSSTWMLDNGQGMVERVELRSAAEGSCGEDRQSVKAEVIKQIR